MGVGKRQEAYRDYLVPCIQAEATSPAAGWATRDRQQLAEARAGKRTANLSQAYLIFTLVCRHVIYFSFCLFV